MPIQIQKIMRSPVHTVGRSDRVVDVLRVMQEKDIRHAPVLEAGGQVVGVISDRDIREVIIDAGADPDREWVPESALVEDVMSGDPIVVTPLEDLQQGLQILESGKISCLPVVDHGKLVGIVTNNDMLRAFIKVLDLLDKNAIKKAIQRT